MRRQVAVMALLVGLAGCGVTDSNTTTTGSWLGLTGANGFALVLVENSGVVSGSGTLTTFGGDYALTVTGSRSSKNVSMTMTSGLHPPVNFTGTIEGNRMDGTVTGSGFQNDPLGLVRQ